MFGLLGVYRGRKIFAVLPRTRVMGLPIAIAFKVPPADTRLRLRAKRDPRVHFPERDQPAWLNPELNSDADLRSALEWLDRAYEAGG
jgi:hypothetical protein